MTLYIIIITVLVSVLAFSNRELLSKLMFNPYMVKHGNQWYRAFTHALIHGSWMHLLVNMWVLWNFGDFTEDSFIQFRGVTGPVVYLSLYVGGVLFASLPSFGRHQDNFNYNSLGASGAVSAVLFSSIFFSPTTSIYLMLIPIPIPAIVFGVAYLALEWYLDKNSNDNVAHDAHFWGAGFGFVYSMVMAPAQMEWFIQDIRNLIGI
jgi:membrane associated rhomboid family serine protease